VSLWRPALILGLLLSLLAALAGAQAPDARLRVHFLDVGQGDAVLIQSPSGQNVLYDGGERPAVLLDHLRRLGVSKIDLVIASHNHVDHIGGLVDAIRAFPPRFYLDNGIAATTLSHQRVLTAVRDVGAQLLESTNRRIALGDATLVVVAPPRIAAWEQNDNSVGAIVEYGPFRLSLAGDAEPPQWAWWLAREQFSRVDVHKASHHGSRNGDTPAALVRLSPEVVVVSAGRANSYGPSGRPGARAVLPEASSGVPDRPRRHDYCRGGGVWPVHDSR
jgi:beta-lactamase superfamily II metal-dependent hydrolase